MSGPLLDRATIEQLFEELANELRFARARVQLYVIGGAAMSMSFDRDRTTQDVDARIMGAEAVGIGRTYRLTSRGTRQDRLRVQSTVSGVTRSMSGSSSKWRS